MIRTFSFALAAVVLSVLLGAACGNDDDGNGNLENTPTIETSATESDQPVASAEPTETTEEPIDSVALAIVTVENETTRLDVQECIAPDDGGAIGITASSDNAELTMVGISGFVTLEFTRGDDLWVTVAAQLNIDGTNITYDGPALKVEEGSDAPEAQILVDVIC